MEEWRAIEGYEGLYEVSTKGRVKSLNWKNMREEKCLFLKKHNKGYLQVELANGNGKKTFLVHRLVAKAFIENPNGFRMVNHKDENKTNNCVENLEWCSNSYNVLYSIARRKTRTNRVSTRKGCRFHGANSEKRIVQTKHNGEVVRVWADSRTIFLETGMSDWSISECCRGNRKTAYGFKWRYAD